ncbi:MAG: family 10 glycosylhydrolase [Prevotella sp.]|nr:family 10 glycosylhydrolase [Candidatus Equicola faecalis]
MRHRCLIIPLVLFCISIRGVAQPLTHTSLDSRLHPKYETRAVWLTTIGGLDWPHNYAQTPRSMSRQKDELIRILDRLQDANINTILLQTRIRGTVIYPSGIEPWDGCLSGMPGKSPGYDALEFAIEECHKRGMEIHAWVVCLPLGETRRLGYRNMLRHKPNVCIKINRHGYMRPECPQTAEHLRNICCEITERYDIDGIHLDYIRYPEEGRFHGSPEWKRNNITHIVRTISDAVKTIKPWVKMSCSPIGKYHSLPRYWSHGWDAHDIVFQDAQGWLRDGLMDVLFPMMYFRGNNFYPFAADWKEHSYGRTIAPGVAAYFLSSRERNWPLAIITREVSVLRQFGMGHAFFRSRFFTEDTKGIYQAMRYDIDFLPALVPPMAWMNRPKPSSPNVTMKERDGIQMLFWEDACNNNDSPYLYYNIYRSHTSPVNTDDISTLVATRIRTNAISFRGDYHYALTAVDRYGQESLPAQVAHRND